MTVGSSSDATMAVIQIQRVPPRLSRARALGERMRRRDSSSVTMMTYSIQASIYFLLESLVFGARASRSRMRLI